MPEMEVFKPKRDLIVLQNHGLRRIRFHDLRHTCASLLLANGVGMQDWLGRSDFSATAGV